MPLDNGQCFDALVGVDRTPRLALRTLDVVMDHPIDLSQPGNLLTGQAPPAECRGRSSVMTTGDVI